MSETTPSTNLSNSNMVGIFPVSFNDKNAAFQGHLLIEQTLCKVIYQSSDKDHTSFVIGYDPDIYMLKFVSLGHYFECNMREIVTAANSWNNIYANIKLEEEAITPPINGNKYTARCVVFTPSSPPSTDGYSASLHVLTKVSGNYFVPTSSVERFHFNTIETTDTFLVCGDASVFSNT